MFVRMLRCDLYVPTTKNGLDDLHYLVERFARDVRCAGLAGGAAERVGQWNIDERAVDLISILFGQRDAPEHRESDQC